MKIQKALLHAYKKLYKSTTPHLDARLLLEKATNMSHEQLVLNHERELDLDIENSFWELVERRVLQEPIAYILGKQEFYGLEFIVNQDVLIPRPETELLVDLLLDDYNKMRFDREINILDLGSGSGAISVTLAKMIKNSQITAVDISQNALDIAKKNADLHEVNGNVNFILSNWYEMIPNKKYDYIVSNPPYIARSEYNEMSEETKFEPDIALYSEESGLANYEIIVKHASNYLSKTGKLLLEIGYRQRDAICQILEQNKFSIDIVKHDLSGHPRILLARQLLQNQ